MCTTISTDISVCLCILLKAPKLLAIFSLVLYCFDSTSDIIVGVDLILRCHERYGYSVISLVLLPGLVFGLWTFGQAYSPGFPVVEHCLRALISPVWFIPYSLKQLFFAILGEKGDITNAQLWVISSFLILFNAHYIIHTSIFEPNWIKYIFGPTFELF